MDIRRHFHLQQRRLATTPLLADSQTSPFFAVPSLPKNRRADPAVGLDDAPFLGRNRAAQHLVRRGPTPAAARPFRALRRHERQARILGDGEKAVQFATGVESRVAQRLLA